MSLALSRERKGSDRAGGEYGFGARGKSDALDSRNTLGLDRQLGLDDERHGVRNRRRR